MKLTYTMDVDEASVWMLASVPAQSRLKLPYVQELGDFIAHAQYRTERSGLPSYLIKYTLSGEGLLRYGEQERYVPPGHFFFIDCRAPQFYQTSPRTGEWRVLWLHFDGPGCAYYYERFLAANGGANVGELPPDNGLAQNIYRLMRLYAPKEPGEQAELLAAARLGDILAECACGVRSVDKASLRYVRQMQDYMAAHFRENVTLERLSQELSLDKFYLQKLFVRETGISPNAYMKRLRIACAKELLRASDRSVADVADACGIPNESYFIRLFRQSEGVTPSLYRRSWHTVKPPKRAIRSGE